MKFKFVVKYLGNQLRFARLPLWQLQFRRRENIGITFRRN